MENSLKLNFLPTYSYRFFKVSVIGLVCSTLLLLSIKLFNLEIISIEAVKWVIGFFLSIMAFSTEKFNNESLHFLKYYAGKFTLTLLIGFAFAMNATEFLMHRNMGIKYFDLIIVGLSIYSITYQILKLSAKLRKVEVLDTVFPDNIKDNPTLSWVVLILSLITLSLIFIVG